MNTKVLEYEFQPETVAVVALDDTGRLLIPQVVTYTSIGGHDLGAVCNVVAGSLLCSVWDLCVYQVPSIALDTEVYRAVYGIFRSSSPGEHLFIGYYGVMTIEEEEPPFLYREDGAGNVTPGGLTDQDRADGLKELDEGFVRWVCYIYKIPMDTPYVYAHYLNLPELKYKLMIEYKKVMDNLEDPYHLTY